MHTVRRAMPALAGPTLIVALAAPAAAQTSVAPPADPNPGNLTLTASFDAVSYQALGDTTKAFNGGDSSRVIGSVGIGFSY
jgi:hypothetical protein